MVTAQAPNRVVGGAVAARSVNNRCGTRQYTVLTDSREAADAPTIIAIGPFDDGAHAHHLASAFIAVRQHYQAQLVLLGEGAHRGVVIRETSERAVGVDVHVVSCVAEWAVAQRRSHAGITWKLWRGISTTGSGAAACPA